MSDAILFNPSDVDEAHAEWGANCGPCSLAALLGCPVADVRGWFPAFPARPWVNPTTMKGALDAAGARWSLTRRAMQPASGQVVEFPVRGLAFVQFDGPWCAPGAPVTAAYRHTHWVAVSGSAVYDANARCWLTREDWVTDILPAILAATKRATGWWCRTGIEVTT